MHLSRKFVTPNHCPEASECSAMTGQQMTLLVSTDMTRTQEIHKLSPGLVLPWFCSMIFGKKTNQTKRLCWSGKGVVHSARVMGKTRTLAPAYLAFGDFLVAQTVENLSAMQMSWLRSLRSPGEGNGSPLQYCCLKNPVDKGTWQATIHGVAKSDCSSPWICFCAELITAPWTNGDFLLWLPPFTWNVLFPYFSQPGDWIIFFEVKEMLCSSATSSIKLSYILCPWPSHLHTGSLTPWEPLLCSLAFFQS